MFQVGAQLHNGRYTILKPLGEGGFSQTFEVDDQGTVKVLKVLLESYPKAVALFQREFKVLSQLNHPGIPRVERDGYFMIASADPSQPYHCLIMERVPGVDLRQWLHGSDGNSLEEALALDWLDQLAEILTRLHQQHCFHRDIKPSNIMLRPDGQLVLIDFGAVREMTETFLHKQADDLTSTYLYSRGYTPLEQIQGRAVPASDFFALGRTLVHLLTGRNPIEFSTDPETGALLWRSRVPYLSVALADLIDQLMAPFVAQRPRSPEAIAHMVETVRSQLVTGQSQQIGDMLDEPLASGASANQGHSSPDVLTQPPSHIDNDVILQDLGSLESELSTATISPQTPQKSRWQKLWRAWAHVTVSSCAVTTGVVGLRLLGLLQGLELQAFNQLMQWRSPETLDNRIVLVTIDSNDITYQNEKGWTRQGSLADEALVKLLEELQRYQPRLIGLDIYRSSLDVGSSPPNDGLTRAALGQYDNLIAVCAVGGGKQNHPAIAPPQEVPLERVGFSNIPYDADGQVRRQLVGMDPDSTCDTSWSLSSQLALRYLSQENLTVEMTNGTLAVGNYPLPAVSKRVGGYQHPDVLRDGGYQILLNYRSQPLLAPQISLTAMLDSEQDNNLADLIADKVVLIGTTDRSYGDYHPTPYGELPGVVIQGHMVSQILAAILDQRPLLWGLPTWGDCVWIFGWSLLAGGLIVVWRSPWQYGGGVILLITGLTGLSFILLIQGAWVPLIPSIISLLLTSGVMISWSTTTSRHYSDKK